MDGQRMDARRRQTEEHLGGPRRHCLGSERRPHIFPKKYPRPTLMADHLLFSSAAGAARAEIERLGGRVTQVFTSRAFVASLPDDVDPSHLETSSASRPENLDPASAAMADAWRAREAKPPSAEAIPLDAPGLKPPPCPAAP